jgi:NitT/TauT family transport system substrate-binding protein
MTSLPLRALDDAPDAARELLAAVEKRNGYLPNLLRVLANAPVALETYLTVTGINARSSLTLAERETVQITAAATHGCGFCVAGHTAIAYKQAGLDETTVGALRRLDAVPNARLAAIARFTKAVIAGRGRIGDHELATFKSAGFTDQSALEVVLGVSLATLCNFANNLGGAPLNPQLETYEARAQDADAPVRIGYLPITDAAPLLVAHARGLFEAEGIKAEKPVLLLSWAQVVEAFISGQVNLVHLLSPMTVWTRFGSKAPAKVVAWNHVGGSALTVAPEITTVADLGGKTIAVPFWYSIHNVVVQALLTEGGLTPVSKRTGTPAQNEVNLVVLAPSDMPPALASRQIAGYIVAEPFNAAAEIQGIGKILRFTGDVWKNHACCVVFMHEHDLRQRPEWSQKVVNAIVKAQIWTRANRADAARLLSKDAPNRYTPPHTVPVLEEVLAPSPADRTAYEKSGTIRHPDWHEERIDFQPYSYPSYTAELVRRLKDTLIEGDRGFLASLDPQAAAAELVDDRFVKTALAANGGLAAFGFPEGFERTEAFAP